MSCDKAENANWERKWNYEANLSARAFLRAAGREVNLLMLLAGAKAPTAAKKLKKGKSYVIHTCGSIAHSVAVGPG
jgi:hypothetical protein